MSLIAETMSDVEKRAVANRLIEIIVRETNLNIPVLSDYLSLLQCEAMDGVCRLQANKVFYNRAREEML